MKLKFIPLIIVALSAPAAAAEVDTQRQPAKPIPVEIQQVQTAVTVVGVTATVLNCAAGQQGQCAIGVADIALQNLPRHAESKSGWTFDSSLMHKTGSFNK